MEVIFLRCLEEEVKDLDSFESLDFLIFVLPLVLVFSRRRLLNFPSLRRFDLHHSRHSLQNLLLHWELHLFPRAPKLKDILKDSPWSFFS